MKLPKIVEIYWSDSIGENGWVPLKDIDESILKGDYGHCFAAGYLIREDDETVTIAHAINFDESGIADSHSALTMPKFAIDKIQTIAEEVELDG